MGYDTYFKGTISIVPQLSKEILSQLSDLNSHHQQDLKVGHGKEDSTEYTTLTFYNGRVYYYMEFLQFVVNNICAQIDDELDFAGRIIFEGEGWMEGGLSGYDTGVIQPHNGSLVCTSRMNSWDLIIKPHYELRPPTTWRRLSFQFNFVLMAFLCGPGTFGIAVPVGKALYVGDQLPEGLVKSFCRGDDGAVERVVPSLIQLCCSKVCRILGTPFSNFELPEDIGVPDELKDVLNNGGRMCSGCGFYFYGPSPALDVFTGERGYDSGDFFVIFCSLSCAKKHNLHKVLRTTISQPLLEWILGSHHQ